ncbi:DUF6792 domain-containing protein [Shouchella lonarensis]|uniref:DUF6792 domain-containing protein n=1 Tax=Shouchella lonarensis TaxID=1464122 RepID=A0A1G6HZQ9_9BACI|nr:DUF6792 domain-containing protein [Shouchella lonarensis]SDB99315.1 hypothetical protein SAMN05421737_104236 [Shouchella lonarensis]
MSLSEEVRNELVELQYEDKKKGHTFDEASVEAILKKHNVTGVKAKDITIYKSDGKNIDKKSGDRSGFDGAAIHIYNAESGRNEVYYITRGTELDKPHDILYDLYGVAGGVADDQIVDAVKFYEQVEGKIENKVSSEDAGDMKRYGDGHSLGGHLIATLALLTKSFTDVRGLNAAPVHLHQLTRLDDDFRRHVERVTGKTDSDSLSEKELKALAEDYYKAEIGHIKHLRVKGEPLYAQKIPYAHFFGDIQYLGNLDTPHFPNLFETYAEDMFGISPYVYREFIGAVLEMIRGTGRAHSVDDIANSLTVFHIAELVRRFGPVAVVMANNKTVQRHVYDIMQQFDQMDNHQIEVLIYEFAWNQMMEVLNDPTRRSEAMVYLASIGAILGKDGVARFYRQLKMMLGLGGAGKHLLVSVNTLEGLYELQTAAEMMADSVMTNVGDDVVVTKATFMSRSLAMADEGERKITTWMEKTLENVARHRQFIIQYWEKDDEIAGNMG